MNPLVEQCRRLGVRLWVEGDALAYDAPKGAMTSELAAALKAHKPAILAALAPPDLPGAPPDFAARLSPEDLREFFEERAAILEYDAGLPRAEAELEAARITATYARNRGYLWASLRSAVSGYPALSPQVPDKASTVDSLPFGTATVHVREGGKAGPVSGSIVITEAELEAARKGRTVVRQGTFAGAPEVKA